MTHQRPKRESMPIKEATYNKIKDQIVAKQSFQGTYLMLFLGPLLRWAAIYTAATNGA